MGTDELLAAARRRLDRVEAAELAAAVAAGALVVDTRPAEQRRRDGELPGALIIDRNVLEWRLDPAGAHRLPEAADPARQVVVVCDEGYSSSLAAASLQDLGLARATDLAGGFQAWRSLHAPTGPPARLLLLNGAPGVGKSTLAARYADRHPGTLDLDIDRLQELVGGWRESEGRVHDVLRPIALAMAAIHLAAGRDVVVPQFLARVDEVEAFATVARQQGAAFTEVVLLPDRAEALDRYHRHPDASNVAAHNRLLVERLGGPAFLTTRYDELVDGLRSRPGAVILGSEPDAIEPTYAALLAALDPPVRASTVQPRRPA